MSPMHLKCILRQHMNMSNNINREEVHECMTARECLAGRVNVPHNTRAHLRRKFGGFTVMRARYGRILGPKFSRPACAPDAKVER